MHDNTPLLESVETAQSTLPYTDQSMMDTSAQYGQYSGQPYSPRYNTSRYQQIPTPNTSRYNGQSSYHSYLPAQDYTPAMPCNLQQRMSGHGSMLGTTPLGTGPGTTMGPGGGLEEAIANIPYEVQYKKALPNSSGKL